MGDLETTPIVMIFIFLFLGSFPIMQVSEETIREPLPIYSATMPFGVFSLKGDLSGFIFTRGSLEGSEIYSIKYLEDGSLKTLILDAVETPLKVDGTLQVVRVYEKIGRKSVIPFLFPDPVYSNSEPRYEVHIPYLPDVEPLTEDWSR